MTWASCLATREVAIATAGTPIVCGGGGFGLGGGFGAGQYGGIPGEPGLERGSLLQRGITRPKPPPKPPKPCTPTPEQLKDSGEVKYDFTEGSISYGLFYSHIEGRFQTSKGYSGRFETSAKGAFFGAGTGVAEGFGKSQSLATFTGANYNLIGTLGPIDISDNFSTDLSHVGQTDAAATPGLGIGVTKSYTTIRDVMCPQ